LFITEKGNDNMLAMSFEKDFHVTNQTLPHTTSGCQISPCGDERPLGHLRTPYRDSQLQHAQEDSEPASRKPNTMQQRLQIFLSRHLREGVTLKDLSTFLGYSQKYCSEFFRLQMGMCFSHYVKNLRITLATNMLMDHDLPLSQIAELLGFSDSFAFSHFFKRSTGCSPSEFRKQQLAHFGFR
jgi:AraC-like DNA-binding protein